MMITTRFSLITALITTLALLATPVLAQDTKPCSAPEFRHFDFWVGEWEVTAVNREGDRVVAGHNSITPINNGCSLHENWRGVTVSRGQSFNSYDASRDVWHQTWVDNSGNLLMLEGGLQDGAMVLSGEGPALTSNDPAVKRAQHRITWQPNDDGTVTQTWEIGGPDAWQTIFQGRYERTGTEQ